MSCKQFTCEGSERLLALIEENKHCSSIFVLFTGSVDPDTGKSWCPDCVTGISYLGLVLAMIFLVLLAYQ